jgi:hypothetical protein
MRWSVVAALAAGVLAGCLGPEPRPQVVGRGTPKKDVRYAAPELEKEFESAVKDAYRSGAGVLTVPNAYEPDNPNYDVRIHRSPTLFFNEQVAACDADGDGMLTRAEIDAWKKRPRPKADRETHP